MPINPMATKSSKPTSLPPIPAEKPQPTSDAQEAVQRYESLRQELEDAKAAFEKKHPKAVAALKSIRELEDSVQDAIAAAKPLVADAKETVGEFLCKRRFSAAHYDGEEVTKILGSFKNSGEVYADLYRVGVVKKIEFDKDRLVSYFARDPGYTEAFKGAWREKTELTPAVTVPKL
jgi:hypothetical protein